MMKYCFFCFELATVQALISRSASEVTVYPNESLNVESERMLLSESKTLDESGMRITSFNHNEEIKSILKDQVAEDKANELLQKSKSMMLWLLRAKVIERNFSRAGDKVGEHEKRAGVDGPALRVVQLELGKADQTMLRLLDSKGADFSNQSILGFTPIHSAVENEAILSLAYFYHEKNLSFEGRTKQGYTPFLLAISQK